MVLDDAISEVNAPGRAFWRDSFVHQKELLLAVEWHMFARALALWCGIRTADGDFEKDIRWKALHMVLVPGTPVPGALFSWSCRAFYGFWHVHAHDTHTSRTQSLVDHMSKVTLERFSAVLEWFGPFAKGDKLFKNLLTTIRIKYYSFLRSPCVGCPTATPRTNLATHRLAIRGFYGDASSEQMGILLAGKAVGSYVIRFSGQQPGFFTITTLTSRDNLQNYRVRCRALISSHPRAQTH